MCGTSMKEKDIKKKKTVSETTKYGPLRWELEQRYPECRVTQFNIIVDVQYSEVTQEMSGRHLKS